VSKLGGGIMLGAGILIAGVSGVCTMFFVEEVFTNPQMIQPILLFGVFPFLLGLALIWGGRRIIHRAKETAGRIEPPQ
jgi:hypothetical protein